MAGALDEEVTSDILPARGGARQVKRIENTERAIRRFFEHAGDPSTQAVAYEAGHCGYGFYRHRDRRSETEAG